MKKSVIAISAAVVLTIAGTASAQQPASQAAPVASAVVMEDSSFAPAVRYVQPRRQVRSSRNGGLFSRMMELERRKNAWLMRTFLGR